MPLLKEIEIENGLLVLWEITEELDTFLKLCNGINIGEELGKFKNTKRQKELLAIRLILNHIGCRTVSVTYNENNQPIIDHPKYNFASISHSDKLAGVMLHANKPVGLDIETTNRDFKKVAHKYMSEEELLLASKLENGLALFWCVKEAIYKAAGISGVHFASEIQITEAENTDVFAEFYLDDKIKKYRLSYFYFEDQLIAYLVDSEK